jgi:hypothetical protein
MGGQLVEETFYADGLVVEAHCVQCGHRPLDFVPSPRLLGVKEPHHRKDVDSLWWPDREKGQRW